MRVCRCYGWTLDYVLSLTYPQFSAMALGVRKVRLDETIDTVYTGYTAGKYGGQASRELFEGRGSLLVDDEEETGKPVRTYTEEQLRATEERLRRYLENKKKAEEAAKNKEE